MVHWDLPRASTSAALLVQLGAEHGVPVETCLRDTGLRPRHLDDPHAEVSAAQELTVIGNLLDALGHPPGLGLHAGARYHLTAYGIWGFALISSPTGRSAVDLGLHFLNLTFAFCRVRAREHHREVQLLLDASDVPPALRRFVIERDAAAIHTMQREMYGSHAPASRMGFAFPPPPGGVGPIAQAVGVTPSFDAAENMVAFDSTLLDVPLPQANAHATALAREQCQDLLERRLARTGLAGRVRDILLARPADPPSADEAAALLHLSPRTLQRRLAQEGTCFRSVLDGVRERLAEELLLSDGLPVAEVAERLGYTEPSSFSQAFRRWKGVGPRAFRARQPTPRPGTGGTSRAAARPVGR